MKTEYAIILLGVLILLFSLYQYTQPPAPPKFTITMMSTTRLTSTTTSTFAITTTLLNRRLTGLTTTPSLIVVRISTTPPSTTTTLIPFSCVNNQLDLADESYVDCSLQCGGCVILNIDGSWSKYSNENLWLKLDNASRVEVGACIRGERKDRYAGSIGFSTRCYQNIYSISVLTTETTPDQRQLALDEVTRIDNFEVKAFQDDGSHLSLTVKKNFDTLTLTPEYVVLSVGGPSCNINQTGFCKRHWMNYAFELRERESNGLEST